MSHLRPLAAQHHQIKALRRLVGRRSARSESGRFVIEGPVLVAEAARAGVLIEAVFCDEQFAVGPEVNELVEFDQLPEPQLVSSGVLESVLSTVTPQPMCAIAEQHLVSCDEVLLGAIDSARPVLVLCELADPGNVGTILRAAEASGCAGVILTPRSVDLYNPKLVRAAAGSLFRVPVAAEVPLEVVAQTAQENGLKLLATVAHGGPSHTETHLADVACLVMGNEAHGLDPLVIAQCDSTVSITMQGPTESLNVAMAATVLCFEAQRQRLARSR